MRRLTQTLLAIAVLSLLAADPPEKDKPIPSDDPADIAALNRFLGSLCVNTLGTKNVIDMQMVRFATPQRVPPAVLDIFSRLRRVEELNADGAASDDLLESIKGWRELRWLEADNNARSISDAGLRHLKGMKHLSHLMIRGQFTDAGLAQIGAITSLRELDIAGTFGDAGLAELAKLSDLEKLTVYTQQGSGSRLNSLAALKKLQELKFYSAKFSDAGAESLVGLGGSLKVLGLEGSSISDKGLAAISRIGSLESLSLRATAVTNAGVAKLAALKNLRNLDVTDAQVSREVLGAFKNNSELKIEGMKESAAALLAALLLDDPVVVATVGATGVAFTKNERGNVTEIDARYGDIHGQFQISFGTLHDLERLQLPNDSGDRDLFAIGGARRLKTLKVRQSGISNAGVAGITGLAELRELSLSHCWFLTDGAASSLAKLKKIETLDLAHTRLSDAGVATLAGLPKLASLDLSATKITDKGMAEIKRFPSLTNLVIDSTSVTDLGLDELRGLDKLREVSVVGAKVSREGVKRLEKALPKLTVISNYLR